MRLRPSDGGFLIIEEADRKKFLAENPEARKYIRPLLCAREYFHSIPRWCLWLVDASSTDIHNIPGLRRRVEDVRNFRLNSKKYATQDMGKQPSLFAEIRQPKTRYVVVPQHSSEKRPFIPFGYVEPRVILHNSCSCIPGATLYHFGVISSSMHMAWVRQVCGRIKSDLRYSTNLVYNNFPWPENLSDKQRESIERAAQAILDVRAEHLPPRGDSTLAILYTPVSMPPKLVKAHDALDAAVDHCYRREPFESDRERVEFLFGLYQKITEPLIPPVGGRRGRGQ